MNKTSEAINAVANRCASLVTVSVAGECDATRSAAENQQFKRKRHWLNAFGRYQDRLPVSDHDSVGPSRQNKKIANNGSNRPTKLKGGLS